MSLTSVNAVESHVLLALRSKAKNEAATRHTRGVAGTSVDMPNLRAH